MSTVHGWTPRSQLRVAVHLPERAALGVVLCPPLGQEGVIAYQTLRLVSEELERRGVASVRYDPPGRGDSGECPVGQTLLDGAAEAAALLRDAGCSSIAYLGLASGALAASRAATADDLLVLWDAPASGRAWLRRQRGLAALTLGSHRLDPESGLETIVGADLSHAEVAELEAAQLTVRVQQRCLVVARHRGHRPEAHSSDRIEVDGMDKLLDSSSLTAVIPGSAVAAVVDWILAFSTSGDVQAPTALSTPALLDELQGAGFVERIRALGPDRLFAIETAAPQSASDAPVVLLHNGSSEHRSGAADYQVTLARELARDGVRSVRFDRRGTGESGIITAASPDLMFTQTWVDDQDAVIAELGLDGDRLAVIGHCVGGWLGAYAAPHRPRLVVSIAQDAFRGPSEPNEVRTLHLQEHTVSPLRRRLRAVFNRWAPPRLRYAMSRSGVRGDVAQHFEALAERSVPTVLVLTPIDSIIFDHLGGDEALRRLSGPIDVLRLNDGDHALFSRRMRAEVIAEVRARVAAVFAVRVPGGFRA